MIDQDSLEPTSTELELLAILRANPHLSEGVTDLLKRLKLEENNGANAHEIEFALREELHKLGNLSLKQWAKSASERTATEACENDTGVVKHQKKDCGGTPPLE